MTETYYTDLLERIAVALERAADVQAALAVDTDMQCQWHRSGDNGIEQCPLPAGHLLGRGAHLP